MSSGAARVGLANHEAIAAAKDYKTISIQWCQLALALSHRLPEAEGKESRRQLGRTLLHAMARQYAVDPHSQAGFECLFAIEQLGTTISQSIASSDLTFVECVFNGFGPNWQLDYAVIAKLNRVPELADCLRHPACVSDIRQKVLHRLEELAFPPDAAMQERALVPSVATGLAEPLAAGVLAAGRQEQWEQNRRFRTTAVAWLKDKHPEIAKTLDEPYRPKVGNADFRMPKSEKNK